MTYGKYEPLVREVVAFVESGSILRAQVPISDDPVRITTDIKEAICHAWEELIDDEMTWADLREREKGKVYSIRYDLPGFESIDTELSSLLDVFSEAVKRQLPREYSDLMDDIVADLHACAFSRAVSGTGNQFFERLFAAYRAGGWPCGWLGRYPEGQLLVFQPAITRTLR